MTKGPEGLHEIRMCATPNGSSSTGTIKVDQ